MATSGVDDDTELLLVGPRISQPRISCLIYCTSFFFCIQLNPKMLFKFRNKNSLKQIHYIEYIYCIYIYIYRKTAQVATHWSASYLEFLFYSLKATNTCLNERLYKIIIKLIKFSSCIFIRGPYHPHYMLL